MTAPSVDSPTLPRSYLYWALAVIVAANFLNYLDRTVVSALEHEINENLGLGQSDSWKFGLLWSAFTFGYMCTSPLIGFWADRVKRTRMFAACVLIWSLATVGCGLTADFWVFLTMRVLIGVGEAGCLVIGPTLLSDYFPRKERGRILALLFLGTPLGGAAGYIVGGQAHWPYAFYLAGLPGIPVAIALFLLREPSRGASDGLAAGAPPPDKKHAREVLAERREEAGEQAPGRTTPGAFDRPLDPSDDDEEDVLPHAAHGPPPSWSTYKELLKTRTLLWIILAQAAAAFTLVPLMHYGIGFFETQGVAKGTATNVVGAMVVLGGLLGTLIGGLLGDRLGKRDPGAYALLAAIGYGVGMPATVASLHLIPSVASYALLFVAFTMFFMCMPLVNTQIANVVSPQRRAAAYAAAVFILHILGDTVSAPLFGLVSDHVPPSIATDGKLFAFTIFPCSLVLSTVFCLLAWRTARADVDELNAAVAEANAAAGAGKQPPAAVAGAK